MSSNSALDPHDPYVLDTRPLGRSAGSMRTVARTVPALPGLRAGLVEVPEGSPIGLDMRMEAVMDGVLVSGTATAEYTGECARCLDPLSATVSAEFTELFAYPGDDPPGDAAGDPGEDVAYLVGDLCDLTGPVRDAVMLAIPPSATCRPDCPGLCPTCGVRLADAGPDHVHDDAVDPRWASLRRWSERS